MSEQVLKIRETLTVYIIIAFLIALSFHSFRVTYKDRPIEKKFPPSAYHSIVIAIDGAVKNPGRYHFKKGITIGEILQNLQFLDEADVSRLPQDQVVKKSRKIIIPRKKTKKPTKKSKKKEEKGSI